MLIHPDLSQAVAATVIADLHRDADRRRLIPRRKGVLNAWWCRLVAWLRKGQLGTPHTCDPEVGMRAGFA